MNSREGLVILYKNDVKKRIEELRKEIEKHRTLYYEKNAPIISDYEYDLLERELKELEETYPEFKTEKSPTQKVGGRVGKGFATVNHPVPLLSLENVYNEGEVRDWISRIERVVERRNLEFVGELKFDGLSVALFYENGKLVKAATRGDGTTGEDVTLNILKVKDVPKEILFEGESLIVRGEIFMPIKEFKEFNERREEEGLEVFANPRNAAAGSLRQIDPSVTGERPLSLYVYQILRASSEIPVTHFECLNKLKEWGFPVDSNSRILHNEKGIYDYYSEMVEKRESFKCDADGIVIKLDLLELQRIVGTTAKAPRWAVAFKFPPEQARTKVKEILIQVGRTGALTPVANLEPVKIGGVVITRVSLHNEDELKRKDVREGDEVLIERAGGVIPYLVRVFEDKRANDSKEFVFPETCPVCGSRIHKTEGEVIKRCSNRNCKAQLKEAIRHFASREAMDISGLGKILVDKLVEIGKIKSISDIYSLSLEDIAEIERMGKKSAQNLIEEIEKSKKRGFDKLLYALGIRMVGVETAKLLSENFNSIDSLRYSSEEELMKIEGIGPKVSKEIVEFFKIDENLKIIENLKSAKLKTEGEKKAAGPLTGFTFVVTGSLSKMTRAEAKKMIEQLGGKVANSVTKGTDYLVVGEEPGSKLQKAKNLNIKILNEKEFYTFLSLE